MKKHYTRDLSHMRMKKSKSHLKRKNEKNVLHVSVGDEYYEYKSGLTVCSSLEKKENRLNHGFSCRVIRNKLNIRLQTRQRETIDKKTARQADTNHYSKKYQQEDEGELSLFTKKEEE